MPSEGYTLNMQLFNTEGREVAVLANNLFLAIDGVITWDGVLNDGLKAPMGIYIVFAEVFDLNGSVERHKLKFTLARRE
jgi:hypothetical protein